MTSYASDNFGMGESDEEESTGRRGARGTGKARSTKSASKAPAGKASDTPWHLTLRCDAPVEFHNQEGGRRKGFPVEVAAMRNGRVYTGLKGVPEVALVYHDERPGEGDVQGSKDLVVKGVPVLEVVGGTSVDMVRGVSKFLVRINDVSQKHGGRHFRLRLSVADKHGAEQEILTRPIHVLSKWSKRSSLVPKPRPGAGAASSYSSYRGSGRGGGGGGAPRPPAAVGRTSAVPS